MRVNIWGKQAKCTPEAVLVVIQSHKRSRPLQLFSEEQEQQGPDKWYCLPRGVATDGRLWNLLSIYSCHLWGCMDPERRFWHSLSIYVNLSLICLYKKDPSTMSLPADWIFFSSTKELLWMAPASRWTPWPRPCWHTTASKRLIINPCSHLQEEEQCAAHYIKQQPRSCLLFHCVSPRLAGC